jgi:outer membrane biosynthesis protein TonB
MKKKVDVYCAGAFVINGAPFAGKCLNIVLTIEDIRMCLLNKAFVWELTPEGKRIPLDFTNYRLNNGGVVDDNVIVSNDARMRNNSVTRVVVDPETSKIVKKTEVVVEKIEKEKPKVIKEDKKKEVVIEKKEEVKEDAKVVAEMDVTTKVEEVKEEKKFDKFDNNFKNNNKHNKK